MNWKKLLVGLFVAVLLLSSLALFAVGAAVTAGVAVAGEAIQALSDNNVEVDVEESGRFAFRGEDGARFSFDATERELVVTDADGDRVRVVAPRVVRHVERFDFDGPGPIILWPAIMLAPLVALGKGLSFLAALSLIVVGIWLITRYRRPAPEKAPKASNA